MRKINGAGSGGMTTDDSGGGCIGDGGTGFMGDGGSNGIRGIKDATEIHDGGTQI